MSKEGVVDDNINTNPEQENEDGVNTDVEQVEDGKTLLAEGEKPAEKGDDSDDPEKGEAEGEKADYDKLTFREGEEIDQESFTKAKEVFAGLNDGKGLSEKDAQAIVDMRNDLVDDITQTQTQHWDDTFSEWAETITNDKELGGENLEKSTIPNVMKAAEKYGDKEMVQLLLTNKMYGQNPSLIRLLNKVGSTLSEDTHVRRSGNWSNAETEDSKLRKMFPTNFKDNKE